MHDETYLSRAVFSRLWFYIIFNKVVRADKRERGKM